MFCYQWLLISVHLSSWECKQRLQRSLQCETSPWISRDQTLSPFHAAVAAVRSHKVHAVLHIYCSNLHNTRSKQASPSRYYFSMLRYQEAVKKMIDPESWRHTAAVYSSRFKIIACFPPPIFCLSTAIISAILAAPYSADGSHCLLLLRSPQTGFKAVLLVNNRILKGGMGL